MKTRILWIILMMCLAFSMGTGQVYAGDAGGTVNVGVDTGLGGLVKVIPVPTPPPGSYTAAQNVTLAASGSTAIYYTLDDSTPTVSSIKFTGAIVITVTTTIKCVGYYFDGTYGPAGSYAYTISTGVVVVPPGGGGPGPAPTPTPTPTPTSTPTPTPTPTPESTPTPTPSPTATTVPPPTTNTPTTLPPGTTVATPPTSTVTSTTTETPKDTKGNDVTVTGGVITVTTEKGTPTLIGTSTISFPVVLLEGAILGSITDTNGLTFANNTLVIPMNSAGGNKSSFFNIVDEISNLNAKLTIKTGDATTEGREVVAQVKSVNASAKFTMRDFTAQNPSLGRVASTVNLDLNTIPENAEVKITTTLEPSQEAGSAFQLAATASGMGIYEIAYVINVTKTNLENVIDIKSATVTMKVGNEWVKAHGGVSAIKIFHYDPETKTQEVAETRFAGYDDQGLATFEGISPHGLSIFGLVGIPLKTTGMTAVTAISWPILGGEIAGAIVAVFLVFFILFYFRRRRKVTTQAVTVIGKTSATGNGKIIYVGAPRPTEHGVVWKTSRGPTTSDHKTTQGAVVGRGPFTSDITGLSARTRYYVRAYVTNSAGTVYGNEVSFTTP